MADTTNEKVASSDDFDYTGAISKAGFALDERRRAALAEVDNAKFSYVYSGSSYLIFGY
jgi:hypothetical protein